MIRYLICTFYLCCAAIWFYGWLVALHSAWAFATMAIVSLLAALMTLFVADILES